jgi:UDP-N-acetylmuramyl pentapeptide phosphotransferase/UDP-N-acetylglucosamine-1-phosphate transferase
MSAALAVLIAAVVAAAVAHVGARAAAASGPQHAPRVGRSSHSEVTPSGGGLGILAGAAAGMIAAALLRPQGVDADGALRLALIVAIALGVAGVGLLDDLFEWSARLKFALLGASSVGVAYVAGAPAELPFAGATGVPLNLWIAAAGATLWTFTAKNAVNFMDGANGLVGGAVGVASAGLAVLALAAGAEAAALAAAALAGALLGFLPVNAPPGSARARVFMGDAGSLFVGTWFAAAGLLFVLEAPRGAVYLPPLLLLPILADVLLTLAWHVKHGVPVTKPHLDHSYQVRIKRGESHAAVVRAIWTRAAMLAALALGALLAARAGGEPLWTLAALGVGVAASVWWWRADRVERRPAED